MKIAKCRHVYRLAREASFYDELEPLQGVATARCFGWFEARIPADVTPTGRAAFRGQRCSVDVTSQILIQVLALKRIRISKMESYIF